MLTASEENMRLKIKIILLAMFLIFGACQIARAQGDAPTKPKKVEFGGAYLGINRTTPIDAFTKRFDRRDFSVSVMAVILIRPKKRTFALQFQLIQPINNQLPIFRIGLETKIF